MTLQSPAPGTMAGARFGPLVIDPATRDLNLQAEVASSIPGGKAFRLTLYLTHDSVFPDQAQRVLARANRSIKGDSRGRVGLNASIPRHAIPGKPIHAFIELSSADLDRRGRPGPPAAGKLVVRGIDLLSSSLPAASTIEARRRSFLQFAGRSAIANELGGIHTKSTLRMPGLLASIIEVKDPRDPRLTRFMEETVLIVKALRANKNRVGPFEIYFPIANHVAAKRLLGTLLTSHPEYPAYEKAVFDFQCSWPDYKSNGDHWPRSPIREAKTIADVPGNIDNGNFRLLVTAAGYLSAQTFPRLRTTLVNPKTGEATVFERERILREMTLYLRRVYHSIATCNTWEYGAQTYLAIDFAPIHMIAEYAEDPEIRRIAVQTLDCLYSSLATSLNQGHYIHAAGRSKGEFLGTGSAIGFIGWLAFGSDRPGQGSTTPFNVYPALPGRYRVPDAIRPTLRFPYAKRERIGDGSALVATYTWQSRSFGLTNAIEARAAVRRAKDKNWDRDSFFKEAGRNKLNWIGERPGGFSPQWENSRQPYGRLRDTPNGRYYGSNPWSQVVQHQGTQIGLADVRDGYPFRKLYVSYPVQQLRARVVKSDWTLCHSGSVVFAFRSLKQPTTPAENRSGQITDYYDYRKTAWILEVAEAPKSQGRKSDAAVAEEIERFHRTLLRSKVEVSGLDDASKESPVLAYTSPISGRTLKLDAAVYPIPADGDGVPPVDYPVLATDPVEKGGPRVLQQDQRLRWFGPRGETLVDHDFRDWVR
ncbi:MAG: hypothetical protein EAZ71_09675 [Verrucomicrobia bacterium]|nr:MAG: hypothetical protein EAZ82_09450 [Verrucomicrobiota bacterium]TAF24755.1 MAG: hypothetical protein EAZ71_09675 [Verrucomicrobiota bacterium]